MYITDQAQGSYTGKKHMTNSNSKHRNNMCTCTHLSLTGDTPDIVLFLLLNRKAIQGAVVKLQFLQPSHGSLICGTIRPGVLTVV